LQQAGYQVLSYEVSRPRAQYAAEYLNCTMLAEPNELADPIDCFFSAHVIEHLPDPNILWEVAAGVVHNDGVVVIFTPNGNPARAALPGSQYHKLWGQVHPLLLSAEALHNLAHRHGFAGVAYSSPYGSISSLDNRSDDLLGDELIFIARRC
jgi:2-polyprenyl-3-methyl-5-hydroxy-6-metoxy-1,4-benzoquinol methylase